MKFAFTSDPISAVEIRHNFLPGDIGRICYLHGTLYAAEQGWDYTFEAYVARPLAEFALRINPRERIWLVQTENDVNGCIAIVEADDAAAQLRWYLLHPQLRGQGVGQMLLNSALEFSRGAGYRSVFLWTVRGLDAAAALYRKVGFQLTEEKIHRLWGQLVCEQRLNLCL